MKRRGLMEERVNLISFVSFNVEVMNHNLDPLTQTKYESYCDHFMDVGINRSI